MRRGWKIALATVGLVVAGMLTLDDTAEFFNLVLGTKLTPAEKQDLVAFLRAL